ncbi:plasmid mobilization relaxosome protein MobC [Mucilaginibacter angelicae]|uniref:Plasmid mobilization relaxosome protein MobC n=1 Tax=Mucilaginibacter angelicae TaxID=869718 RepID=A0ABV6L1J2_9SPHI
MEEKKTGRVRIIGLRLTGDEYRLLEGRWKKSMVAKLSEFVRRVLFGKAITIYTRSQSLDEFMEEMILLRKELNAIGVNFNQAVHRLHTLDHLPQMQRWLQGFERDKERYFEAAETIKLKINSISAEWLQ